MLGFGPLSDRPVSDVPTNFDEALSESVGAISEALATVYDARPTPSESWPAIAEAIAHQVAFNQDLAELVADGEALVVEQAADVDLSESIALAEQLDVMASLFTQISESVAVSAQLVASQGAPVALAESVPLSELLVASHGFTLPLAEAVSVSDFIALIQPIVRPWAWWKFDDESQDESIDEVGAHDLVVTSSAEMYPRREGGRRYGEHARRFTRADQVLDTGVWLTDSGEIDTGVTGADVTKFNEGDWSTAFWFKRNAAEAIEINGEVAGSLIEVRGNGAGVDPQYTRARAMQIQFVTATSAPLTVPLGTFRVAWTRWNGASSAQTILGFTLTVLPIGVWKHIAFVRTFSVATVTVKMYVDGALVQTLTSGTNGNMGTFGPSNGGRVVVGASKTPVTVTAGSVDAFNAPVNATLGETLIFLQELTQQQIQLIAYPRPDVFFQRLTVSSMKARLPDE